MKFVKRIKRLFRSRRFRKKFTLFVSLLLLLTICAVILDIQLYKGNVNDTSQINVDVVLPEKIYVTNDAVLKWLDGKDTAKNVFNEYRQYGRLDYTNVVNFAYAIDNLPLDCFIENQELTVYDSKNYKKIYVQNFRPEERSIILKNLRPDTSYEYYLKLDFSNGECVERTGTFKTEASPCFLYVDGIRNVRDIGATKTIDGKQIKKYMVYRGSELDGAIEPNYIITKDGIDYMLNDLNIKSEIDLRLYNERLMCDALGPSVFHNYYTILGYNEFFEIDRTVQNTEKLFSDLANPDMYPIYIHCSYGVDRTGTVIYVLEALLGVDEKTLYQEWECSVICHGDAYYDEMNDFVRNFKALPGNTMQEKAENYLLSIGVTQQEIDSIREILLTD